MYRGRATSSHRKRDRMAAPPGWPLVSVGRGWRRRCDDDHYVAARDSSHRRARCVPGHTGCVDGRDDVGRHRGAMRPHGERESTDKTYGADRGGSGNAGWDRGDCGDAPQPAGRSTLAEDSSPRRLIVGTDIGMDRCPGDFRDSIHAGLLRKPGGGWAAIAPSRAWDSPGSGHQTSGTLPTTLSR